MKQNEIIFEEVTSEFRDCMYEKLVLRQERHLSWRNSTNNRLIGRILEETSELMEALEKADDVHERTNIVKNIEEAMMECVDVANYAMFIWDNLNYQLEVLDEEKVA